MTRTRPTFLASLALASLTLVAACSAGATSSPAATAAGATASAEATSTASASAATASAAPATTGKVSANTATQDELVAALTAAGVPNPDRWAREIQEYRPYDASDATLQKLQDNLAKYDPSAATLAGILAALEP